PNLFGMNFQALSVGQKLIEKHADGSKTKGGYLDPAATPSDPLLNEIEFVDAAIGQMVMELKNRGILHSTLIVVSSKHGQSPIDPNRFKETGNGIPPTPADVLCPAPGPCYYLPQPEDPTTPDQGGVSAIGPTQDDISLLWLKPGLTSTDV